MAFRDTKIEELEYVAQAFRDVSDSIFSVIEKAKEAGLESLVLQMDSVRKHYLTPCERLAASIDLHFRDQLRCRQTGEERIWQKSVRKSAYNKALDEAKAERIAKGLEPKQAAKKATKKKASPKRKG